MFINYILNSHKINVNDIKRSNDICNSNEINNEYKSSNINYHLSDLLLSCKINIFSCINLII